MGKFLQFYEKYGDKIKGNNALIIAVFTALFTLGSYLVKFSIFIYKMGIFNFWNISYEYINVDDSATITFFLFYGLIFVYVIICGKLLSLLCKQIKIIFKDKKLLFLDKVKDIVKICVGLLIFAYVFSLIPTVLLFGRTELSIWSLLLLNIVVAVVVLVVVIVLNILSGISKNEKHSKTVSDKIESSDPQSLRQELMFEARFVIIGFALVYMVVFWFGFKWPSMQKSFDVIKNENYVIVSSYEDKYILLQADYDENNKIIIDVSDKKIIDKTNVELVTMEFDEVTVINK